MGENNLARYKFENFVKEIYVDSDTKVALLSGAPFDDPTWDLLTNDQIARACGVTVHAVKKSLERLFARFLVSSRAELIATLGVPAEDP